MTHRVGFTGSRSRSGTKSWIVQNIIVSSYREHSGDVLFKLGDCPTGLDHQVKSFLETTGWLYKEFFANWRKYKKAAGPIRNHEMVDSGLDELYAFPEDDSRGTKDCAEYAASKGVVVHFPELPAWAEWASPINQWRN